MEKLYRLKSLYQQLDENSAAGEDVVAETKAEIRNLELSYLKEDVFSKVAKYLGQMIKDLRCGLDCSIQYDENGKINYSFCTSGSTLLVKDTVDTNESGEEEIKQLTSNIASSESLFPEIAEESNYTNEDKWINRILAMRCMPYKGFVSPHKPIFILTILEMIELGLTDGRIFPSGRIMDIFDNLWERYVPKIWPFIPNVYQPFIHMGGESFYHLEKVDGVEYFNVNQNWNRSLVLEYVEHGTIDKELFTLLQDSDFRKRVKDNVIRKFIIEQEERFYNSATIHRNSTLPVSDDNPDSDDYKNTKHKRAQIKTIRFGNVCISEGNSTKMMVDFINKIGPQLVYRMHINYLGGPLVDEVPHPKYERACKRLNLGYWLNTNSSTQTKVEQIKLISRKLNIPVEIEMTSIDDDYPTQENEAAISIAKGKGTRERRKSYSFNGIMPLNKRKTVFEVVKYYLSLNPNSSFQQIKRAFPDNLQGSYGVVASLSYIQAKITQGGDHGNRYFIDSDQILKSGDGVLFAVSNQWGNQFERLRKYILKKFGWRIDEV